MRQSKQPQGVWKVDCSVKSKQSTVQQQKHTQTLTDKSRISSVIAEALSGGPFHYRLTEMPHRNNCPCFWGPTVDMPAIECPVCVCILVHVCSHMCVCLGLFVWVSSTLVCPDHTLQLLLPFLSQTHHC